MISDEALAKEISDLMLDIFCRVDASLGVVKQKCPSEEARAYQRATGKIVGPIVMDVLGPLYDRHPSLKPARWDDDEIGGQ